MGKRKKIPSSAPAKDPGQVAAVPATGPEMPVPAPVPTREEPPATLGQKIFLVALYLYVASLVWLVLSHHWYGVLPAWLDPH